MLTFFKPGRCNNTKHSFKAVQCKTGSSQINKPEFKTVNCNKEKRSPIS
jgi:hypothetical protein